MEILLLEMDREGQQEPHGVFVDLEKDPTQPAISGEGPPIWAWSFLRFYPVKRGCFPLATVACWGQALGFCKVSNQVK